MKQLLILLVLLVCQPLIAQTTGQKNNAKTKDNQYGGALTHSTIWMTFEGGVDGQLVTTQAITNASSRITSLAEGTWRITSNAGITNQWLRTKFAATAQRTLKGAVKVGNVIYRDTGSLGITYDASSGGAANTWESTSFYLAANPVCATISGKIKFGPGGANTGGASSTYDLIEIDASNGKGFSLNYHEGVSAGVGASGSYCQQEPFSGANTLPVRIAVAGGGTHWYTFSLFVGPGSSCLWIWDAENNNAFLGYSPGIGYGAGSNIRDFQFGQNGHTAHTYSAAVTSIDNLVFYSAGNLGTPMEVEVILPDNEPWNKLFLALLQ